MPDPTRIVEVHGHYKEFESDSFSYPVFLEMQRQRGIFADLIGFRNSPVQIDLDGGERPASLELVTGGYFRFFGALAGGGPAAGQLRRSGRRRAPGVRLELQRMADTVWRRPGHSAALSTHPRHCRADRWRGQPPVSPAGNCRVLTTCSYPPRKAQTWQAFRAPLTMSGSGRSAGFRSP